MSNSVTIEPLKKKKVTVACAHCGLPCENEDINRNSRSFCCLGCASVYELLNTADLCKYYDEGFGISPVETEAGDFDYLDASETIDQFVVFKNKEVVEYKFLIPDMHCSACIYLLERLDKFNNQILNSRVDFLNKELLITVKNKVQKLSSIVELLFRLGYKPDLSYSVTTKAKTKKWNQKAVKIGVAGFCFGNIMMLSFPEYLGLSQDPSSIGLKRWFDFLSLLLSIPVLVYCSSDFFQSSIKALRSKTLNIDVPVSIAILTTFGRSVFELFFNQGTGYFDSMTGIVFLMLTGRYFQDLTFHSLTFDRNYKSYFPLSARRISNGGVNTVNIAKLKAKDKIELRNSELLPADAILESELVTIDYSFITGESKPVVVQKGEKVYAGAIIKGRLAKFTLISATDNSRLVKLWSIEKYERATDHSITEKINYYFTLVLLFVSAFAFIYQYQIQGIEEAFKALSSVLIVACPCILLLASTFANGHILRVLKKYGMFVKNNAVLSRLDVCDTIVFDKTGTLTNNKVFVIENLTQLNDYEMQQVTTLCHQSVHPYSEAIYKKYGIQKGLETEAFTEIIGKGILGKVGGDILRLGSSEFIKSDLNQSSNQHSMVHIEINNIYRGCFKLNHQIRANVNQVLTELKNNKFQLYLSSGDTMLNESLPVNVFSKIQLVQQPEDKVNLIKELKKAGKTVCMMGDGLNDGPALNEANVSISISDNENAFFPASDVMLKAQYLHLLPALFKFIKSSKWVIIISFVFSLIYNVIGLYYAITAQLSPLTAAILMPSSTITMLLLTWGLTALISNFRLPKTIANVSI